MSDIAPLLTALQVWAQAQPDVLGLALVGSYARSDSGPHSDVDVLVLTTANSAYRKDPGWLKAIDWPAGAAPEPSWEDVDYGLVWSRHLHLADGTLLELGFAEPTWADVAPLDSGTRAVVRGGCRILWDPEGLIRRVVAATVQ
jgi:hypothetical protein